MLYQPKKIREHGYYLSIESNGIRVRVPDTKQRHFKKNQLEAAKEHRDKLCALVGREPYQDPATLQKCYVENTARKSDPELPVGIYLRDRKGYHPSVRASVGTGKEGQHMQKEWAVGKKRTFEEALELAKAWRREKCDEFGIYWPF
ncbi:hypothetical protein L2750_14445 [Shewanella submarina]|uniref:Uncharacterized protein n=1 Tax=Shewanella submarina TaxID=2016376 RepID=A0ABV7G574_9GAMM|nr:hypothetical protein [Shewanella submarina]MCL1038330.1 hypothetical protein [Shewanella submarina]